MCSISSGLVFSSGLWPLDALRNLADDHRDRWRCSSHTRV